MDRQTLTAIVLCFLIFLGWQKYYVEPRAQLAAQQQQQTQTAATQQQVAAASNSQTSSSSTLKEGTASTSSHAHVTKTVTTSTGIATVGDNGQFFVGWNLKSYKLAIAPEAAAVDLKSVTNTDGELEVAFDHPDFAYLADVQGSLESTPHGVVWTYEDAKVKMVREISSDDQHPYANAVVTVNFKGKRPSYAFVSLASQSAEKDPEAQDRKLLYFSNNSLDQEVVQKTPALKDVPLPVKWIAASNRYFLMSVVDQGLEPRGLVQPVAPHAGRVSLVYPVTGDSIKIPLKVYFGPKELDLLRMVDPTLDHAVDFGWFTAVAYPILKLMKFLFQFVKNYGLAIILLTILLKLVTYPLTYKSVKSMKEMARIQPQLQKLREKHKDDREALNREMLTLMKSHGYNPMAGCLPILIQMPVFFALYRVLYSSIELYHAPFGLWIHDLSYKDPLYVTPVLLAATMFIQQKLTPNTATDPAQQKMLQFMPLIFGVMMINLPSGLTIYMLTNALASIIQQTILNKKFDAAHSSALAARAR